MGPQEVHPEVRFVLKRSEINSERLSWDRNSPSATVHRDESNLLESRWVTVTGKSFMGIVRSSFLIAEAGKIVGAWYKIKPESTVAEAKKALGK
jgi:hypothetical protein